VYVICACLVFLSVGDLLVNCFVMLYNKCGNMHGATLKITIQLLFLEWFLC